MSLQKEIKVFIASPDEVITERRIIEDIINELNDTFAKLLNINLKAIKWEQKVIPQMGRPQQVINEQIKPNECSIFIGILWTKFGSRTGGESSIESNHINSGTEEEFELAYNSFKDKGSPYIMFYRSYRQTEISNIDPNQLQKVNSFFKRFKYDGKTPGIYSTYTSIEEFTNKIRHDLIVSIDKLFPNKYDEDNPVLSEYYRKNGFVKLFLPQNNSVRTINKSQVLSQAKYVNLIAETGHAYLASISHRYRDIIEKLLKNNCEMKVVLSNPFSVSGVLRSFSEEHLNNSKINEILKLNNKKESIDILIKLIKKSKWFNIKLMNSLDGYRIMKEKYQDLIQLKFTKLDIPASIAITDNNAFFEPYLNININERTQKEMMTFDMQVTSESHLYRHLIDYFNSFWDISEEINLQNINAKNEITLLFDYLKI